MVKQAVIPVAGKGTRFLPATKEIAKEIIPILKTPMIHYVVQEAIDAGIEQIIFVTSEGKEEVANYFKPNSELEDFLEKNNKNVELELIKKIGRSVEIKTVEQKEQLGLGHAINCAKDIIGSKDFAVLLGDDILINDKPVIGQLMEVYKKYKAPVIGVMKIDPTLTYKYGIVAGKNIDTKNILMEKMVEKPAPKDAPSDLATPGRYILSSDIFKILDEIPRGAGGEYQLTDAINELCNNRDVYAHIFDGKRYDTGSIEGYFEATLDFALNDPEFNEFAKKAMKARIERLS